MSLQLDPTVKQDQTIKSSIVFLITFSGLGVKVFVVNIFDKILVHDTQVFDVSAMPVKSCEERSIVTERMT